MFVNFFKFKILPPICRNPPVIPFRDFAQKKIPIRRPFPLKFNESPDHTRHSVPFSLSSGCIWFSLSYLNGSSLLPQFSFLSNRWRGDRDSNFLRFNSIWLCCNLVNGTRAEQERNGFLQIIHVPFFVVKRTPGRCFPPTKKKKRNHKTFGEFF